MPETPTSTFRSRPNIGVASPVSVVPKSHTYSDVPPNAQLSVTPPVSRKSTYVPSGAITSSPPEPNVVIQKLPSASILKPSWMWPSASSWITSVVPSGRRRTTRRVYDSTQTMEPSGSATTPFGYTGSSSSSRWQLPSVSITQM